MSYYPKQWVRPAQFILLGQTEQPIDGFVDQNPDEDERILYPLFALTVVHEILQSAGDSWGLRFESHADAVVVDMGMGHDTGVGHTGITYLSPIFVEGIGKLYPVGWDADEWEEI